MTEKLIQDWLLASQTGEQASLEEERIVSALLGSLNKNTITFPEFIGSVTTRVEQETDLTVAGRALSMLPRVFVALDTEPSRNDVHAFVPYLSARLQDASPGVYYISETLTIMSQWKRFPPGDAQEVLRAIFTLGASNNFSSQTANTRLSLYNLVDTLRRTHSVAVKRDMSEKEIVKGVVTMAELEKNPSCLRALFNLYISFSQEWQLDADDYKLIFDSFIRYFPITMKDAPKDPKIPSTTELRGLLMGCFVANDGFSQMTFDAMVERLDVDSANTKVEVFKTLTSAVQNYSVMAVSNSATKLWDSLKFEIWNGENDQWIQSSLDVLREIALSLDRIPCEWLDKDNLVYKYLLAALAECRDRIKDKPHTYLGTSGRIFNAFASASPYPFYLVSRTVIPIMDTLAQAHSTGIERTHVLEVLNGILRARLVQIDIKPPPATQQETMSPEVQEYRSKGAGQMASSFSSFRDRLVEIYHEGISQIIKSNDPSENLSHCVVAIKGLELIFDVPAYLSEAEKGMIVGELAQVAFKAEQNDEIREASLTALGFISGIEAGLFRSIVLPAVLGKLPDKISAVDGDVSDKTTELGLAVTLLDYLVRISSALTTSNAIQLTNFHEMEDRLLRKFVDLLSFPGQLRYQQAILAAISAWFEATKPAETKSGNAALPISSETEFNPIHFLLHSLVEVRNAGESDERVNVIEVVDESLIRFVGEYIMRSIRYQNANLLVRWEESHPTSPSGISTLFQPVELPNFVAVQTNLVSSPEPQWLANALSMYLVAGTRREDVERLKEKFSPGQAAATMINNAVAPSSKASRFSRLSSLHFLQLLVNKFGAAKGLVSDGGITLTDLIRNKIDEASSKSKEEALNTYQTLAYFAAASLAALDGSATTLLQYMLDNLKHPKYGRKVAQSFRLLLAPSDILIKENFCLLRPLRKGRLYQIAVQPLIATWRTSEDVVLKESALIALTGVITFLEPSMLSEHAKELLPVLLEGTNVQGDQFAKSACIKGILDLMSLAPSLIEEHLAAVIERMTDRTHNTYDSPSDSNVRCRAMALEVLAKLPEVVGTGTLLKRKAGLMRELDVALEDCSSEVRAKAERCKMAWFNMVDGE